MAAMTEDKEWERDKRNREVLYRFWVRNFKLEDSEKTFTVTLKNEDDFFAILEAHGLVQKKHGVRMGYYRLEQPGFTFRAPSNFQWPPGSYKELTKISEECDEDDRSWVLAFKNHFDKTQANVSDERDLTIADIEDFFDIKQASE